MHDNFSKNRQHDFVGKPRGGLLAWLRAWHEVMREPNRLIPEPRLPSEGEPVPHELGLSCPECGRSISGLSEWRCSGCGERFNLRRAYTVSFPTNGGRAAG